MPPRYFGPRTHALSILGHSALDLVSRYGSPLFVFVESKIVENIAEIRAAYSPHFPQFDVMYASKACANLAILDIVRRSGCGVEVNSGGELHKALRAGFRPEQIVFNGVAKSAAEVELAVRTGIHSLNVDSLAELERIAAVAAALGRQAGVTLRLVPSVMGGTVAGFETGHSGSKFGMLISELDAAGALLKRHAGEVRFRGFHFHVGSQVTHAPAFSEALGVVLHAALRFQSQTGLVPELINMGGGFPIELVPDGQVPTHRDGSRLAPAIEKLLLGQLSLEEVAASTAEVWDKIAGTSLPRSRTQVLVEPGRRVVGNAGVLLCRVESRKSRPNGLDWLMLDVGFNTLPETLWYDWYYHAVSASRWDSPHDAPFRLGGPLCDTGDSQHDERSGSKLPDVRRLPAGTDVGDLLAFLDTGAYAIEQQNNYNGRPRASAVLIRDGGEVVRILRGETYEDLLARDIPCPS